MKEEKTLFQSPANVDTVTEKDREWSVTDGFSKIANSIKTET